MKKFLVEKTIFIPFLQKQGADASAKNSKQTPYTIDLDFYVTKRV